MNAYLLLLIGIFLGIFNSLALKLTINIYLNTKNTFIIFLSFFLRMFFVCIIFYIFLDKNWMNAVLMLIGLTISKLSFIIYNRMNGIKK